MNNTIDATAEYRLPGAFMSAVIGIPPNWVEVPCPEGRYTQTGLIWHGALDTEQRQRLMDVCYSWYDFKGRTAPKGMRRTAKRVLDILWQDVDDRANQWLKQQGI